MKYLRTFESLHLSKSVESYAKIVDSFVDRMKKGIQKTNNNGEYVIYLEKPLSDFPIDEIKIIPMNSNSFTIA